VRKVDISGWTKGYLSLVAFSLAGFAFSRGTHRDSGLIAPICAFLTLLVGVTAAFRSFLIPGPVGKQAGKVLFSLLMVGSLVELEGVGFGIPFGHYRYTDQWAPVVVLPNGGWFPLPVPIAWALMIGAAGLAVARFGLLGRSWTLWQMALTAAGLATAIDFVMEPVMTGPLHYWEWVPPGPLPGGAAWLNPIGWFVTSFVGAVVVISLPRRATQAPPPIDATVVLAGHVGLTMGLGLIATLTK